MARRTAPCATGWGAPVRRSCSGRSTIWPLATIACTAQRRRRASALPLTLLCRVEWAVVRLAGPALRQRVTSDFDEWCSQDLLMSGLWLTVQAVALLPTC